MSDCRCNRGMTQRNSRDRNEKCMDEFPVGMAYVPWQNWNQIYELDKALNNGTLFPELDKPFIGRRACR
ncbi:MAG: spore coat associated protein CotJA [Lachnospiraceae bacterium]|nr:spore coat associated protein CotJA [Lachnospiraceae bacterium]